MKEDLDKLVEGYFPKPLEGSDIQNLIDQGHAAIKAAAAPSPQKAAEEAQQKLGRLLEKEALEESLKIAQREAQREGISEAERIAARAIMAK